jgi:hypothetical protein
MPHDLPDDGVPMAASITGGCCEHGTVTLELFDEGGNVIARAHMPMSSFDGVVAEIQADVAAHNLNLKPAHLQ